MNIFTFIKSRVAILDVTAEYTHLKRAGHYWKGRCPFHNERTASFTVSPHREIFYCFGCHRGGDVIAFITEAERCTPLEATRHLAHRYQITLPSIISFEKQEERAQQTNNYTTLCTLVAQWCHQQLSLAKSPYSYCQKRGLTTTLIDTFYVGYFPNKIHSLLEHIKKEGFLSQNLIDAHILFENKHGLCSPFEERIIFPIKDHLGRICGFGGRTYKDDDQRPKYYNSQDHTLFSKGTILFGLDSAKKDIQEHQSVFLVEGYLDCIAMVGAGYTNSCATLGTACTAEHLKLLSRYTQKLYVMYDGDQAGRQAIMRLVQLAWQSDLELFIISLPEGDDPASFLLSKKQLHPFIEQAEDIFVFFLKQLGKDYASKPLQERLKLVHEFLSVLTPFENSLKKNFFLERAAMIFNIPLAVLHEASTQSKPKLLSTQAAATTHEPNPIPTIASFDIKLFVALLRSQEALSDTDKELIRKHSKNIPPSLIEKLLVYNKNGGRYTDDTSSFLELLTTEEQKIVACILILEEGLVSSPLEVLMQEVSKKEWKLLVHAFKLKLSQAEKVGDKEAVVHITQEFTAAKNHMKEKGIL